ncbi:26704_t:CDS:1, partial [Racocetra persica]
SMSDNSESDQKNKKRTYEEFHDDIVQYPTRDNKKFKYFDNLKPTTPSYEYCGTATVRDIECDIDYYDLKNLEFVQSGGFGTVYKGLWKEQHIAAKFVNHGSPTELKDFGRE